MGTRADFYIGEGAEAEWIGSVAWDGYEWAELDSCPLMLAQTADQFRLAVSEIAKERDDWTSPEQGWPWPWGTSAKTDGVYWFHDGKALTNFRFGEEDEEVLEEPEWPDMSAKKNVTLGPRSGLIIVTAA